MLIIIALTGKYLNKLYYREDNIISDKRKFLFELCPPEVWEIIISYSDRRMDKVLMFAFPELSSIIDSVRKKQITRFSKHLEKNPLPITSEFCCYGHFRKWIRKNNNYKHRMLLGTNRNDLDPDVYNDNFYTNYYLPMILRSRNRICCRYVVEEKYSMEMAEYIFNKTIISTVQGHVLITFVSALFGYYPPPGDNLIKIFIKKMIREQIFSHITHFMLAYWILYIDVNRNNLCQKNFFDSFISKTSLETFFR